MEKLQLKSNGIKLNFVDPRKPITIGQLNVKKVSKILKKADPRYNEDVFNALKQMPSRHIRVNVLKY